MIPYKCLTCEIIQLYRKNIYHKLRCRACGSTFLIKSESDGHGIKSEMLWIDEAAPISGDIFAKLPAFTPRKGLWAYAFDCDGVTIHYPDGSTERRPVKWTEDKERIYVDWSKEEIKITGKGE